MSSKGLDRPLPSLIYQGDAIHDLRRVINMPLWDDYQEEVCEFFRNADMQAETNISVQGVRASHDIDVVVRSRLVGFELLWLVECKHWRRRVSKLHVLALREIVADVGADRGILMAEQGFQRGALDAARLTNVQLTSLANLANTAGHEIGLAKLRVLQERLDKCRARYWNIDKTLRVQHGLSSYWGQERAFESYVVMQATGWALNAAFRGIFPVIYNPNLAAMAFPFGMEVEMSPDETLLTASTPNELFLLLEPDIIEFERRLDAAEGEEGGATEG
jgi:hypothetical protein